MKRKRSSSHKTTDLCGSFLVNVLDLSKILNGKNKSRTVHKLSCLKELLDIGGSSTSDDTIVISDDTESETDTEGGQKRRRKIKKEMFESTKMTRFKKSLSDTEDEKEADEENDDSEEDISKIKNYVKESLLKGLSLNSHNFNGNEVSVKEEPCDELSSHEEKEPEIAPCETEVVVESKEDVNQRKRIRFTQRRNSSYQSKRLLRHYRNLKRRPKIKIKRRKIAKKVKEDPLEELKMIENDEELEEIEVETTTEDIKLQEFAKIEEVEVATTTEELETEEKNEEIEVETKTEGFKTKENAKIEEVEVATTTEILETEENSNLDETTTTKMTGIQSEITQNPDPVTEETLPSSTTSDPDILTLSRLEELKVQITEDDNTVYITILDGTITIPDVLEVLNNSSGNNLELVASLDDSTIVEILDQDEVEGLEERANPYFSQLEYKSCYSTASISTETNVKTLYEIITYPEVKKNLKYDPMRSSPISARKPQKSETPYSYKTIDESVFTLAPTNCNYINHVHWTNSYPLSYETNAQSHRHLCVLKDLYRRGVLEKHIPSEQPVDMRCNYDHLPKPKEKTPQYIPPTPVQYHPYQPHARHQYHQHHQEVPHQRYNSYHQHSHHHHHSRRSSYSHDVSYTRQFYEQKQQSSCRYPQWKPPKSVFPPPTPPVSSQSHSFIDIPIYSPAYNIKIPPLRIPIAAIAPTTAVANTYKPPAYPSYGSYNRNFYHERRSYPETYSNYAPSTSASPSIMRNLLQMEPKSRFVWS
ncbi:uncharacterized protein LOC134837432 [Culicoides brevitarsis]|uniref:uncharacterized protein LOC134837432 n=1 Tax=Culicoides brevitarsis TaxID=469753 RepID=UPI00307BF55C